MAPSSARIGRRRRVLSEEVRTSSSKTAGFQPAEADGDTPRYGFQANIENHPQITDFVPRRYRKIALIVAMGTAGAVAAEALAYFANDLSSILQVVTAQQISAQFSAGLITWTSVVVLLVAAVYARVIFSLRRHRVDDYRGRYRVWRTAAWLAIALSMNAVLGVHTVVATLLSQLTGWNLTVAGTLWWLVPAAMLGGWLLAKLAVDVSECRVALAANLLGGGCLVLAAAAALGWAPEALAVVPELLSRTMPLLGFIFLLASCLLYARYVVLDVQGLITHAEAASPQAAAKKSAPPMASSKETVEQPAAATTEWLDGSQGSDEREQGTRRLSKSERKRLRKLKQRNRAA